MKKINVFVGHYGSGKTEVAVNFAIKNKVGMIADLVTVNPYFRTNDAKGILTKESIKVVSPYYAGTNVDIPALPPEIYSVFSEEKGAVLDVGGDDDGAAVLGRFHEYFLRADADVFCVVNVFRPETDSVEKIIDAVRAIEGASRLCVTALVNNSNLMGETERRHIERGGKIVREACEKLNVRFFGNSVMESLAKDDEFKMKKYIIMQ